MANAADSIGVRVSSRRGSDTIHPVSDEYQPPAAVNPNTGAVKVKHLEKPFPLLIPFLVVANTVLFIITMYVNNCPKNSVSCVAGFLGRLSFQPVEENPLLGPSSSALEKMGALYMTKVVHQHEGWRFITSMWLHGGLYHLLVNILSLLAVGIRLEQDFGIVCIGLLYLISGFGGTLLSALFTQSNAPFGASHAVHGLPGGMLSELITNWSTYSNKGKTLLSFFVIITVPLAENFTHIGGFLSGVLVGFVLLIRPQPGWCAPAGSVASSCPKFKPYQCILRVLSITFLIVGFSLGLVLLLY